jgi:DNA-binding transcriptional MerR regulator
VHHVQTNEASMKHTGIRKLYYSISEVSKITGLEQYVLRYWETEFDELKPAKNRAGNRIYTNKDIKLIMHLKQLLRDEKYTIEGAKQVMKDFHPEPDNGEQLVLLDVPVKKKIQDDEIREEMTEVKTFLQELIVKLKK